MPLRPYQTAALDALRSEFRQGARAVLLVSPTGSGKTTVAAEMIRSAVARGNRVLFVAHRRELVYQAIERLWADHGIEAGVLMAGHARRDDRPVQVASIQTLLRRELPPARLLICDEAHHACFVAGTMVGDRRIEELRRGDSVPSFDAASGMVINATIVATMRSRPRRLIRVWIRGVGTVCTDDHPFLTPSGWTKAVDLGDTMVLCSMNGASQIHLPGMRDFNREKQPVGEAQDGAALHSMQDDGSDRSKEGCRQGVCHVPGHDRSVRTQPTLTRQEAADLLRGVPTSSEFDHGERDKSEVCERAHEEEQPDAPGEKQRSDVVHATADRTPAALDWRQGKGGDRASGGAPEETRAWMGAGIPDPDEGREPSPELHLHRHRECGIEDRDRGRWCIPQTPSDERAGQAQDGVLGWARVDGVEVLERGPDSTFGGLCPDGFVYNIEVSRTHTYLANGTVVHNCADSWRAILAKLPGAVVVGLTASPWRLDGRGLGDLFTASVLAATPAELLAQGYLCPATGHAYVAPDLGGIATRGGEYDPAGLTLAYGTDRVLGDIVDRWRVHCGPGSTPPTGCGPTPPAGRRTILFAATIEVSRDLVERFRALGVAAEHLDYHAAPGARREIVARVRSGATTVISNVGILGEGVDVPELEVAILARPTKSLPVYLQQVGRVLRPAPGKAKAIIHDHAGLILRHGFWDQDRVYSLTQTRVRDPGAAPVKTCPQCFCVCAAGCFVCPECGSAFPARDDQDKGGGEHKELTIEELRALLVARRDRDALFQSLMDEARATGRRPGWVIYRLHELLGDEMPFPKALWRAHVEGRKGDWRWREERIVA